jgi:nitrogen fixation NifU-like protein
MTDLRDLYQEVILDHNKSPHNYREMADPSRMALGHNPLCGDRLKLYVQLDGDRIADVAFQGSGCAISKASASVMSSTLKGKTTKEAHALFDVFHKLVTGEPGSLSTAELGRLAAFSGVSEFPARVKCASLPWHTLNSAIEGDKEVVSTE